MPTYSDCKLRAGPEAVQRILACADVRQARRIDVSVPEFHPMPQLQTKRSVASVGDKYEQEADQVAGQVVAMPAPIQAVSRVAMPEVQRKTGPPLPEVEEVAKKWKGLRTSKTQKMNKAITKYNDIPDESTNYKAQIVLLQTIVKVGWAWLAEHSLLGKGGQSEAYGKLEAHSEQEVERYENVEDVVDAARDELEWVQTQNVTSIRSGEASLASPETNVDKAMTAVGVGLAGKGLKTAKEQGGALDEATKAAGGNLSAGAAKFFKDAESARKQAQEGFGQGDGFLDVLMNSAKGFGAFLQGTPLFQGLGFVKSILGLYTTISDYLSFKKADKALQAKAALSEDDDEYDDFDDSVQVGNGYQQLPDRPKSAMSDAVKHGLSKVWRRVWSAVYDGVSATLDLINFFISALGPFGTMFAAVVTLGKGVLTGILKIGRTLKGAYKRSKGTRGVHRQESAETTVREAMNGDETALQLLVDLSVVGMLDRVKTLGGVKNPTTTAEMSAFLTKLAGNEFGAKFTMDDYVHSLGEKWKSFT